MPPSRRGAVPPGAKGPPSQDSQAPCAPPAAHVIESRSAAETWALGERLAGALGPGLVVALVGALGTGKTVFAKGIVAGLSATQEATSPSFSLVNVYEAAFPVYHLDFYRLAREEDAESLGLRDYLDGHGVVLVEWADRIPGSLPEDRLEVTLARTGDETRTLTFRGFGPRAERTLSLLAGD